MPSRSWIKSRRTRWLARREARPLPLRVGEANCQGVTKSAAVTRHNIREAAKHADLIFFSEVANVRVALALGPAWDVWQAGDTEAHSDRAGCAIALRRSRGFLSGEQLHFGSSAGASTPRREGIRDRWIPSAYAVIDDATPHEWSEKVAAYHAPPMRWWSKWPGYMVNLARLGAGLAGGDGNKLLRPVSVALRRRVGGNHVTGIATRWWLPVGPVETFDVGSDHRMTVRTVWP